MTAVVTPGKDNLAPKTLTDLAYSRLREDIIHGRHAPDAKLRVEHLRLEYELGATPLREALSRLSSDGLVVTAGQRGFRVAPISVQDLDDVTELRVTLELKALRESMILGDDAWESRVVASFHQLTKAETGEGVDIETWERRNLQFHRALISACSSAWLLRFYAILYDQHKRYRNISLRNQAPTGRDLHHEHQRIFESAMARDLETACAETDAHIRRTAEISRIELLCQADLQQ